MDKAGPAGSEGRGTNTGHRRPASYRPGGEAGSTKATAQRRWRVRLTVVVAMGALAGAGVGYVATAGLASYGPAALASRRLSHRRPSSSAGALSAAASCPQPVSRGDSCVLSDAPPARVILQACDHFPAAGDTTGACGPIDHLPDGTQVIIRCWIDTGPPPDDSHTSPRWFYVNEANGPHPGYSGYIYSALVVRQISAPPCTRQTIKRYQYPARTAPPPLRFQVTGSCTSAGGALTAVSANFTPGAKFSVTATYPDGSSYPLAKTTGTVSADGSVPWSWPCAGDPAGTYHTQIVDLSGGRRTGSVPFTIAPAAQAPPPGVTPTPRASTPPPRPKPGRSSSPPPDLDANATPAYGTCPSSPPPPDERNCGGSSSSCASPSLSAANCPHYVPQATEVKPVCWVTGQIIYNSYSAAAPGPKWTLKSAIWIQVVDFPSDPWMSELWFSPDNTASDGLPHCRASKGAKSDRENQR